MNKVAIRYEGGAGDILLGHRFACAIKEKYPNVDITCFIDSEGKTFQKEVLSLLYPLFYKEIFVIPNKKYKKFVIDSQFGQEEYKGAYENIPDEWRAKIESYDKWYDLHIDSLKFIYEDFDWYRYFHFFPKPERPKIVTDEKYIAVQLISNTKNDHGLQTFYTDALITKISSFVKVKVIATSDVLSFYEKLKGKENIEILDIGLDKVCDVISGAQLFLSIDSGLKYIAYSFGIPTLCLSKQVSAPMQPFFSHQIRWMPFPETCFPLHYDLYHLSRIVKNILEDGAYILNPISNSIDQTLIKRKYTINEKESILL